MWCILPLLLSSSDGVSTTRPEIPSTLWLAPWKSWPRGITAANDLKRSHDEKMRRVHVWFALRERFRVDYAALVSAASRQARSTCAWTSKRSGERKVCAFLSLDYRKCLVRSRRTCGSIQRTKWTRSRALSAARLAPAAAHLSLNLHYLS